MTDPSPLAAQDGDRAVRVAVVDSGIDAAHLAFARASFEHYKVVGEGDRWSIAAGEPGDVSGHGTACAGIVHRMVPQATLVNMQVIQPGGRCDRRALIAALKHCIVERYEVVSLSLGIDIPRGQPLRALDYGPILDLYELADAAYTRGVVIVAAGPNAGMFRTYPGKFKSLVGVGRAPFARPEGLRTLLTADYEIVAPGENIVAPAAGGGERKWTGTSFAVPHVAAHIARIRAARPELRIEAVRTALHALAAAFEAEEAPCDR